MNFVIRRVQFWKNLATTTNWHRLHHISFKTSPEIWYDRDLLWLMIRFLCCYSVWFQEGALCFLGAHMSTVHLEATHTWHHILPNKITGLHIYQKRKHHRTETKIRWPPYYTYWNFGTARVHGHWRSRHSKVPKWPAINGSMLSGQCGDAQDIIS